MPQMTQAQIDLMKSSYSAREWNRNIESIRREHDGDYPDDWYAVIVESGIARSISARWGSTYELRAVAGSGDYFPPDI